MAPDIEFIVEIPVTVGDGKVKGNGDIEELGFHIRHWEESDGMPAFATRHLVRVPTGHRSSGVDYLARGLFTKTLVEDSMRLHFNPFLKTVDCSLDDGTRRLQWGAAIGIDYRVNDDLFLIADYQNFSSEE